MKIRGKEFIVLLLVVLLSLFASAGCLPSAEPEAVAEPEPEAGEEPQPVVEPEEVFEWRAQGIYTPGDPGLAVQQGFVDRVRELSGGRLDITLHPIGAIVPPFETFEAVATGALEVGMKTPMWWGGKEPVCKILTSLPGSFTHAYQLNHWFWEHGGIEIAREAYARHNIYFVGPTIFGAPPLGAEILHSSVPIRRMEDFQGLKVRSGGAAATWFEALGASVVSLPGPEIFVALEKGVVDVAEWVSANSNLALGLHEAAPYIIVPGLHTPLMASEVIIYMDVWNELPDDLKAIVEVAVKELSMTKAKRFEALDGKALETMEEQGAEIIEWTPEEVARARDFAQEIWDDFAVDELSERALESQMNYLRLIGIIE